jgi:hypothetical protein
MYNCTLSIVFCQKGVSVGAEHISGGPILQYRGFSQSATFLANGFHEIFYILRIEKSGLSVYCRQVWSAVELGADLQA